MSISYITAARAALFTTLESIDGLDPADISALKAEIKLRKPKEPYFGDLSTNASILLKSQSKIDLSDRFIEAFDRLDGIKEVQQPDNGHINLIYKSIYWLNNIIPVLNEGVEFALEGMASEKYSFSAPAQVSNLASFREQANFEALERIATLVGAEVVQDIQPEQEAGGYPHQAAIAKCTEAKTRFAVLANPPGFIDAFSPILAIDKSYDNPVFAIPYARLMLARLGTTAEKAKAVVNDGVDMSGLALPEERALARYLNDWPLALEQALRKGDAFYLASFLQELSLLFFRLVERVHPISSNYLTTETERPARLCLLGALDRILISGVRLLGVDAVKEYG
jgi:arginyl-tRNA synthetase